MAILRRAEFVNFLQHRHQVIETGPGITLLVGPNGSGKTNCMLGILYSLTGSTTVFPGSQDSLIRHGEVKLSYCRTTWELADGTIVEVCRYRKGGTSYLKINGQQTELRRAADITERLEQLLGYQKETVCSSHYVAQSATDAVLQERPTSRVSSIAEMFGLERLLLLNSDSLKAEQAWVSGRLTNFTEATAEECLQQQKQLAAVALENWRLRRALIAKIPNQAAIEEAVRLRNAYATRELLIARRQRLTSQISELQGEVQTLTEQHTARSTSHQQLVANLSAARLQVKAANEREYAVRDCQRLRLQYEQQTQSNKAFSALLANVPIQPQFVCPDEVELDQLRQRISDVSRDLSLVRVGAQVCQTCGQAIKLPQASVADLTRELSEAQRLLQQRQSQAVDWQIYSAKVSNYNASKSGWQESLQQGEQQCQLIQEQIAKADSRLSSLGGGQAGVTSAMAMAAEKAAAMAVETASVAERDLLIRLTNKESTLNDAEASLQEVRASLAEIAGRNDAAYKEAESLLVAVEVDRAELTLRRGMWKQLKVQWRQQRNRTRQARAAAREHAALARWSDNLRQAAEVLKPTVMPRAILSGMLDSLTQPMSMLCQRWQQPFVIVHDESLELQALHSNGRVESVRCLSGGQKACVATAFWVAKLLRLQSGLPLLIDEPSANLDSQAVVDFGDLLLELSSVLQRRGRQIILTSHHRQLERCGHYSVVL